MKCDFSFRHYREILKLLKEKNYRFCFFSEKPNEKIKKVYLRHDVDLSLEKAFEMAQIENQNKVSATYFIRFSSPFYNVFEPRSLKIIKEIINLGHNIGLHFESDSLLEKEVLKQIRILKTYFDLKEVVSFHRPTKFMFNKNFKNFISSYSPRFFRKIKYISDSKGNWPKGCACQWLNCQISPQNLQILTHPASWGEYPKASENWHQSLIKRSKYLNNYLAKDTSNIYNKKFYAF